MIPSVKDIGKVYSKWEQYSITTKTFELRPFEKPDMSPYLIHMTNSESLFQILNSKLLIATKPSQSMSDWYDEKIVCFTESPTFAIDFFRYKSYKRWCDDLRFGLGFSKLKLALKGVRPALYVDKSDLIKCIAETKIIIKNFESVPESDGKENLGSCEVKNKLKEIYKLVAPYMTPLDHDHQQQGFLWEREWRYAQNNFEFEIEDIEIICCPKSDRQRVKDILGTSGTHIKYIETWGEYNEISKYLEDFQKDKIIQEKIDQLSLKDAFSYEEQITQEVSKLKLYESQLESMISKVKQVKETIIKLEQRQGEILEKIELEKEKNCVYCGCDFEEAGGIAMKDWNDDGHFCSTCYAEMNAKINDEN
ncbi:hypothetical protein LVY74_02720 [Acinetobacter sp. ME22]|uniref:hypothetical protein n=1 Tax=Acinetobacter sp. ME22 TaxID=2904802 RepID=UPI001EDC1CD3|nr:hypothetical protein [Acinetobacter sp. ME22]MCG2572471.1 hypothetical protein [Acinetobacter sp. ME22]